MLDRVDIVDVVERRMTLKKSGKNYSGLCPFHDEKTPSFSVSPDKQFFHCFGCQESGTALSFIMKFDRLEFVEAVEALAQQLGMEVPREKGSFNTPRVDPDQYTVLERCAKHFRNALRESGEAVQYLKERGLTGEVARDYGVGFAPDEWQGLTDALPEVKQKLLLDTGMLTKNDNGRVYDRFRGRIMFPIRDTRGRVIAFGGRVMSADDGPKYLNSPETEIFHKSRELYGLYEARKALRNIHRLIVVEGYMDVVALAQYGVMNAVATLGTASGTQHFQKLYRYTDEVVCCFDGDQAGRSAAWKALENALPALGELKQLKFVFLPDGEDPDSLVRAQGRDAFERMVDNALPGIEFLLQRQAQGLDLETIDGRSRFAGLVAPFVEKIPPGLKRSMLEQRVREMSGMARPVSAPASSVRRPERKPSRSPAISDRLLTVLLKSPGLWHSLHEELTTEVRGVLSDADVAHDEVDPLEHVIAYIATNAEVECEELLVWFDDAPFCDRLRELAVKPLAIDEENLPAELNDLCSALLKQRRNEARRLAMQAVKETQDVEQLRKYSQMHKLQKD